MNGRQRVQAAFRGQEVDSIPIVPMVAAVGGIWGGISVYEFGHDGEKQAQAQIGCARRFGYDGVYICSGDCWANAEAIGYPHMQYSENELAYGHRPWIEDEGHLESLELPDPASSGRWPVIQEAVRRAVDIGHNEIAVIANFDQSPFSVASELRGINQFMLDLIENKGFAHKLLEFCTEAVVRYAVAQAEAGGHVLHTGDSPAGGSLIGRELYEEFGFPYEKKMIEAIHAQTDVPVILHICGDSSTCLDLMMQTGADGIEIDYMMDLGFVRELTADRVTLLGNVNPLLMIDGDPQAIREDTRHCIEVFEGCKRFICSSACVVPLNADPDRLLVMIDTAREFGAIGGG